jgi:aminotransferase
MKNYHFTNSATNVPNSGISYMMNYASKYNDVVSLGQGNPQFPTPSFIYDYLHERAKTDPSVGIYSGTKIWNELKILIAKQMNILYGFTPEFEEIELTIGGIGALFAAIMTFVEKDDEVIYFDPSYPLHLAQIHIAQAKPIFVSYIEQEGWKIDLNKLKKSITPKTKAIILTNPNNPTGTVLSETEVKKNFQKLY